MCIAEETTSLTASTDSGITKVLYGYVPSSSLLASVKIVADTEKNNKRTQLVSFSSLKDGIRSLIPLGTEHTNLKRSIRLESRWCARVLVDTISTPRQMFQRNNPPLVGISHATNPIDNKARLLLKA